MITCPDCGYRNLDGAETCEECESPLSTLYGSGPGSAVERSVMRDRIERLGPREPLVVSPETPVGEVLRRMVARGGGCAVVVDAGGVAGIFTERDALMQLNVEAAELAVQPVARFMTRSVETLELSDRVAFALHKMDLGGYRHIPILAGGRVAGVISVRHILNHITAALGRKPLEP